MLENIMLALSGIVTGWLIGVVGLSRSDVLAPRNFCCSSKDFDDFLK